MVTHHSNKLRSLMRHLYTTFIGRQQKHKSVKNSLLTGYYEFRTYNFCRNTVGDWIVLFYIISMQLQQLFTHLNQKNYISGIAHFHSYEAVIASSCLIGLNKGLRTVFMALVIPSYVPLARLPAATGLQLLFAGFFYFVVGPLIGSYRKSIALQMIY